MCLICSESLSEFKKSNINPYYTAEHSEYDKFKGDIRILKNGTLKKLKTLIGMTRYNMSNILWGSLLKIGCPHMI